MVNPGGEPFDYDPTLTPYAEAINDACDHIDVRVIAVKGNTRSAKALCIRTPIPTPAGWTTMGDLAVGDEIFDDLGRSCRVTLTTPIMHGKECYRLTFSDGSTIIADSEHLWEVERKICRRLGTNGPRRHEWKTEVLMTRDMASRVHAADRKRFRYRVRVAQPLQTPVSDLPIDPYVLGIWLGDGTTRSGQITVHESDREILDHIAVCGMWSQVQRRTPTGTLTVALRLPSEDPALCPRGHTLSEVGRYDCGSCKRCCRDRYDGRPMPRRDTFSRRLRTLDLRMNKHIPPAYLRAGIDQRLALLQGLLDSDGTVSAKGNVLFTNTNARLADEFFELAASLGYRPAMRQVEAWCSTGGTAVRGRDAFAVAFTPDAEVPVFRLGRKRARLRPAAAGKPGDVTTRRIVSIEPIESVPVRCIQVDSPNHLFLAGKAMIPTHNTVSAESMVLRDWTYGPLKNVLWFMQDKDSLHDYIDERGEKMIEIHEEVAERIDWNDSRNKSRTRKMIGRALALWRPATSRALRAKAAPTIVADEIDAYAKKVRDAIMTLVTSRQEEFGSAAKAYLCSHPDAGPDGGIDLVLKDSLLHLWFARCPECGHAASPAVEAEDQGRPRWKWNVPEMMGLADEMDRVEFLNHVADNVRLVCPNPECREEFGADRRLEIMNAGRWLQPHQEWLPSGKVKGEPRVASTMGFVIHAFMAPFVKFAETARDWAAAKLTLDATGNETHFREVVVKKLGETPRSTKAEEQIDPPRVVETRLSSLYPFKSVPPGVMFLTAFVDVQGDRFEVVVIGWALNRESWLIDRYPIKQWPAFGGHGAFEDIDPANRLADWDVIEEAVIASSYPLQSNPQRAQAGMKELYLPIAKTIVNNAGNPGVTNNGRKWLANMLARQDGRHIEPWQVMLMQGAYRGEPYGARSKPVEFDDIGRQLAVPVYERYPNVVEIKKIIAARMKIEEPGPGRMHIPALPPIGSNITRADFEKMVRNYVYELTAERFTNGEWIKLRRRNETWDGYVACEVAREALKADRPQLWEGSLPVWADPKPRGQGLGSMITGHVDVFDRLAKVNADTE